MFAIEEIRGVAFVKRKRLESRERFEGARCPLPAVGDKSIDTEAAARPRERIHGRGIPSREIKIAELRTEFAPLRESLSCALPLRFGRQSFAGPAGVS